MNTPIWQDVYQKAMSLIDHYEQDVLELRHALHQDPELSFAEYHTAERIASELRKIGLDPVCGIAGTGIIVDIHGTAEGINKKLLLRADMDALPIEEKNDLPYKSQNPGVMHACGHDVHTANLFGVARVLNDLKEDWSGTIRCVFQPAEERGGGGREMLKQGIMDDIAFDASMALHTMATLPPGHFSMGWNDVTSFSDRFVIKVYGKQTHSSTPAAGVDAISIAAHIVTGL